MHTFSAYCPPPDTPSNWSTTTASCARAGRPQQRRSITPQASRPKLETTGTAETASSSAQGAARSVSRITAGACWGMLPMAGKQVLRPRKQRPRCDVPVSVWLRASCAVMRLAISSWRSLCGLLDTALHTACRRLERRRPQGCLVRVPEVCSEH